MHLETIETHLRDVLDVAFDVLLYLRLMEARRALATDAVVVIKAVDRPRTIMSMACLPALESRLVLVVALGLMLRTRLLIRGGDLSRPCSSSMGTL